MTTSAPPCLRLSTSHGLAEETRRRIDYTFRVFCAVYGFQPPNGEESAVTLCYGHRTSGPRMSRSPQATRHARYMRRCRPPKLVDVAGASSGSNVRFPVFHGDGEAGPDWLGEEFEWLSAAHEQASRALDAAGRIPYGANAARQFRSRS